MTVVHLNVDISLANQQATLQRIASVASSLISEDLAVKATGGTGAGGVQWKKTTDRGIHTRATRSPDGRKLVAARKVLTDAERRLLSTVRGNGTLPRGKTNEADIRRRQIIGHTICETTEYRRIQARRASLRSAMSALESRARTTGIGVSSGGLLRSFRIGDPQNKLQIDPGVVTIGSRVPYAAAFDRQRTLVPASVPAAWVDKLSNVFAEEIQ